MSTAWVTRRPHPTRVSILSLSHPPQCTGVHLGLVPPIQQLWGCCHLFYNQHQMVLPALQAGERLLTNSCSSELSFLSFSHSQMHFGFSRGNLHDDRMIALLHTQSNAASNISILGYNEATSREAAPGRMESRKQHLNLWLTECKTVFRDQPCCSAASGTSQPFSPPMCLTQYHPVTNRNVMRWQKFTESLLV